jgi:hypothetical protein
MLTLPATTSGYISAPRRGSVQIDKDYVTEEVMVAKRKDWEVAILNISNLKIANILQSLLYF